MRWGDELHVHMFVYYKLCTPASYVEEQLIVAKYSQ